LSSSNKDTNWLPDVLGARKFTLFSSADAE